MQSILYDGAATGNLTMTNDHGSTQSGCQAQLTRTNSHSVDMPREGACSTSDDTNGNDFVAVNGKSPKQSLQDGKCFSSNPPPFSCTNLDLRLDADGGMEREQASLDLPDSTATEIYSTTFELWRRREEQDLSKRLSRPRQLRVPG